MKAMFLNCTPEVSILSVKSDEMVARQLMLGSLQKTNYPGRKLTMKSNPRQHKLLSNFVNIKKLQKTIYNLASYSHIEIGHVIVLYYFVL